MIRKITSSVKWCKTRKHEHEAHRHTIDEDDCHHSPDGPERKPSREIHNDESL